VAALSWKESEYRCVECGDVIADGLARFGSVLCHDCREEFGVAAFVVRLSGKRPSGHHPFRRRRSHR
jgi:hypothetical protein